MAIGLLSMAIMLVIIAGVFLSAGQITQGHLGLLMLGLIVVAIMLGFPTAFTLMGLGMIFGYMAFYNAGQPFWQNAVFDLMVQRTYGVMTNDVLIAVPLFVFMGYIVERANIVDRLFHSIQLAMRHVPGSLAVATIITCAVFATATGIIGAVVTLMGLLALRPMLRAGYDTKLAAGAITAGGCLGILIPPSILLILYGATALLARDAMAVPRRPRAPTTGPDRRVPGRAFLTGRRWGWNRNACPHLSSRSTWRRTLPPSAT